MEGTQKMILRDLPVNTRNYTILDNITGKPVDQSTYSLTIDPEVINKLNALKKVNEEKIKQAALRNRYSNETLVDTFTPEDNSVFTPVHSGEYIDYRDFNNKKIEKVEEVTEEVVEEIATNGSAEVIQAEGILDRVVARDPIGVNNENSVTTSESSETIVPEEENNTPIADNSLFTPEMTTLKQASEQIIRIDTDKLESKGKSNKKEKKPRKDRINLDKDEIKKGRGIAWMAYILFFIPLLFARKNRFVRIHANEGLELNIMEILGVGLTLPYFLLKDLVEPWHLIVVIAAIIGFVILVACVLTIIPMIICAIFGLQFQTPWLWKKRIIKVPNERQ